GSSAGPRGGGMGATGRIGAATRIAIASVVIVELVDEVELRNGACHRNERPCSEDGTTLHLEFTMQNERSWRHPKRHSFAVPMAAQQDYPPGGCQGSPGDECRGRDGAQRIVAVDRFGFGREAGVLVAPAASILFEIALLTEQHEPGDRSNRQA